ncbi:MAG: hypothetical protein AB1782_20120 [Cyanobacteriota bacterium]
MSFEYDKTLDFIEKNILNAPSEIDRKVAILKFKEKFKDIYDPGKDKWQNPNYHQYTVTDHMLKTFEESCKIVNGKHKELDFNLTPDQKNAVLAELDGDAGGISKKTLFVLAMAFHDLDKLFCNKIKKTEDGHDWRINPQMHARYDMPSILAFNNQYYWTCEPSTDKALDLFNQKVADLIGLPAPAKTYVHNILKNHDNPLKYIVWEIENGRKNITQLFEEMKAKTPFPLKELALIYLADQAGKGNASWLEHLENISPWRCIFKSMSVERPLSEMDILLKKIKPSTQRNQVES